MRALLVTTRTGNTYRIAKSDFEVWAIEQKANIRTSPTVSAPPASSHPVSAPGASQETAPTTAPTYPEPHEASSPSIGPDAKDRMIARLESENEFLRGEIRIKNDQLKDATDRSKETNILIHGLQNLVLKLTGQLPAGRGEHVELPHTHGN